MIFHLFFFFFFNSQISNFHYCFNVSIGFNSSGPLNFLNVYIFFKVILFQIYVNLIPERSTVGMTILHRPALLAQILPTS
jgi:hypothetical protein